MNTSICKWIPCNQCDYLMTMCNACKIDIGFYGSSVRQEVAWEEYHRDKLIKIYKKSPLYRKEKKLKQTIEAFENLKEWRKRMEIYRQYANPDDERAEA